MTRDRAFLFALAAAIAIPFVIVLLPMAAPALSGSAPLDSGAISTGDARAHIGSWQTVEGVVEEVHTARNGSATFIDLDGIYPFQPFTAVIFEQSRVGDVSNLEGKNVAVTGRIRMYRDHPEIIVDSRSQILAHGENPPGKS